MEILSTGEKIKRARIYKGITLKEICGDKISISKMSCIENDKVKAERWILEIVAEILDLNIDYLIEDDEYQLDCYLNKLSGLKENEVDLDRLKYYFQYSDEKKYYRQAYKLVHNLVRIYIYKRDFFSINNILDKYFDLYEKNRDYSEIFFEDMTRYFFKIEEFNEALMYLNRLYNYIEENNMLKKDKDYYAGLKYFEARCYYYSGQKEKFVELSKLSKDLVKEVTSSQMKGLLYGLIVLGDIQQQGEISSNYKKMTQYLQTYPKNLANLKQAISLSYFGLGERELALEEIKQAIRLLDKTNGEEYVEFLLKILKILMDYREIDLAKTICEEASNISIGTDNIRLVEKTYYYKALVFQSIGDFIHAEMYMNLSADALMKFGGKKEKYSRYLEMAKMYHTIGHTREALKYFTLAMNLESKMR